MAGTTEKIISPAITYIGGEEMSKVAMRGEDNALELNENFALKQLVDPYVDISAWNFFSLDVYTRDETKDQIAKDTFNDVIKTGVSFKEQTITTDAEQAKKLGLKNGKQSSPNNIGRKMLEGFVIYRNTIHPPGAEAKLGWKKKVFTSRYPLGEGYGTKDEQVFVTPQAGTVEVVFKPADGSEPTVINGGEVEKETRIMPELTPLGNFKEMIRNAFNTCLTENVQPIWVDKGTAKAQHTTYRERIEAVLDEKSPSGKTYREEIGAREGWLTEDSTIEMILSDAAIMRIVGNNMGPNEGGFMFIGPNYEQDIAQDGVSMKQLNPAMVDSILIGKKGRLYDAGHGTDPRNYNLFKEGKPAYFSPISQLMGLWNAMQYAAEQESPEKGAAMKVYTDAAKAALLKVEGKRIGQDKQMTTQEIIAETAELLKKKMVMARNGVNTEKGKSPEL